MSSKAVGEGAPVRSGNRQSENTRTGRPSESVHCGKTCPVSATSEDMVGAPAPVTWAGYEVVHLGLDPCVVYAASPVTRASVTVRERGHLAFRSIA